MDPRWQDCAPTQPGSIPAQPKAAKMLSFYTNVLSSKYGAGNLVVMEDSFAFSNAQRYVEWQWYEFSGTRVFENLLEVLQDDEIHKFQFLLQQQVHVTPSNMAELACRELESCCASVQKSNATWADEGLDGMVDEGTPIVDTAFMTSTQYGEEDEGLDGMVDEGTPIVDTAFMTSTQYGEEDEALVDMDDYIHSHRRRSGFQDGNRTLPEPE
ncbi:expressed unknown protein [Seminavis robusta]|uniref:Uncharacterized protein n=1 Tax=Seminavis robusta TaxID=568900 RepID=A0A9N8H8W4_9STRA|nr:expressed unknown protein [Seminavis robusta]|eukprot:Sro101_g051680.1 n/a (212) ;mRNA; f:79151-79786